MNDNLQRVVVTPCNRKHWQDCDRLEDFFQRIEGMSFAGCNCSDLWEHEPFERWIDAIERDAENVNTLCRIGLTMGIFVGDDRTARTVKGCPLSANVMEQACEVNADVQSASLAVRVAMLGQAAREADRLSIKQTIMSHNARLDRTGTADRKD